MRLFHLERESFIENVAHQKCVYEPCIHARNADDSAASRAGNGSANRGAARASSLRLASTLSTALPFASKPIASVDASTPRPAGPLDQHRKSRRSTPVLFLH
jgi:hypothetical protein